MPPAARTQHRSSTRACSACHACPSRRTLKPAAAAGSKVTPSRSTSASSSPATARSARRRKAHSALLVDGLPALVEQLRAARVTVRDDDPLEGCDRVYVDDPFGNRIELMGRATEFCACEESAMLWS